MEKTNINLNCSTNNTPNCTREDRGLGFNINQPCNGTTRIYFEEFSCIPGEFRIRVFSNTAPPCIMTAIIEFQNGETIERVISNQSEFNLFSSNLRKVSIRCDGNPTGTCNGFGSVEKLFCFCCPDNSNNCCNSNCNSCCSNRSSHISDDHCKKDNLINSLLSLHKPECKPHSGNKKADLLDILAKINLSL